MSPKLISERLPEDVSEDSRALSDMYPPLFSRAYAEAISDWLDAPVISDWRPARATSAKTLKPQDTLEYP